MSKKTPHLRILSPVDCEKMIRSWFLGAKRRDLIQRWDLDGNQFNHQIWNYAKRYLQPFFDEVVKIFQGGGTRALMSEYSIDVYEANKLYQKVTKWNASNPYPSRMQRCRICRRTKVKAWIERDLCERCL